VIPTKFKPLSDRVRALALDDPFDEEEQQRQEEAEQKALVAFVEANMTLEEHRQYHDDDDLTQITSYPIKCSECGKDATVPFKPTEGRAVYSRECFAKKRGNRY
jgi:CxxC-x17-CxxC domain-containing protein